MPALPRFTLKHSKKNGGWELKNQIGDVVRSFPTKAEALAGGTLQRAVKRGTVRIHKVDGVLDEERTFPRSEDPRSSPG
jgi:hypothetical protein